MAQVLSSERVGVTIAPERLNLTPGSRASVAVQVTNRGVVVDQLGLKVEGIDLSWFTVGQTEANLFPSDADTLQLEIHPPADDSVVAGTYTVRLTVASRADPASATVFELPLEVEALGGLELVLTPQRASVRRQARYELRLTNTSNAERVVDLVATDPDEALKLTFDRDRVALGPGAVDQVQLRARPLRRPLVTAPLTYSFHVLALPAAGDDVPPAEPLAGADGTLVYRGLFPFLIGLWPKLRRPLLLLALLALLAALALWALGRAGVQLPLLPNPFLQPTPTPEASPTATTPPTPPPPTTAPTAPPKPTASPPQLPPPTINRFDLVVPSDGGRGDFVLSWDVTNAQEVKLAGQPKPSAGEERVQKLDDTEYVLEATNDGGTVRKSIGLLVLRPPDIQELSASPVSVNPGEAVTLTWNIRRGERADIDGQQVDAGTGSLEQRPTVSHTYTLTAENELGRSVKRVDVRVTGTPDSGLDGAH